MCGITGFAQTEARLGREALEHMTATLVRRGPDESGYYCEPEAGLGMRRLSIIDLASGQQPLWSASRRYVAVFNGEIYNYPELQRDLRQRGVEFRSNGDGEVVVNMYEAYGQDAFDRLRGMFAVAIWDTVEHELVLVRDPLGIKPLFYKQAGTSLLFGSEIKSILAADRESMLVDSQALDAIFAYTYIPAPLTIWKDVRKLLPGHMLRWRDGRVSISRYWDLLDSADSPPLTTEDLRAALDDTVRAHLVSDVEVGAFLSGGLDSSTIVARMQSQMDTKIRAFSVRFDTTGHLFDETRFAEQLRERYGFDLHVESLPASEYEALSEAMRAFDEPFADDSIMPNHAICKMAARHLKVVLSGAGGDEFFGGYNRYQGIVAQQYLARLPAWVRRGMLAPSLNMLSAVLGPGSRRGDLVGRFGRNLRDSADDAYLAYVTAAAPRTRASLLTPDVTRHVDTNSTRSLVAGPLEHAAHLPPLKRVMYADVATYLPEDVLALSDRIGMWHSLEIRTPLADKVLAQATFRLVPDDLVRLREKKVALRKAIAPWLPPEILSHPKQGFEAPTASWLRGSGAEAVLGAMRGTGQGPELLQSAKVEGLLNEHRAGKADHAKKLFAALSVATWSKLNMDRIGGLA